MRASSRLVLDTAKARVLSTPRTSHLNQHMKSMATVRDSISHEERTAAEPREPRIEPVTLSRIDTVNDTIRLLRLSSVSPTHVLKFLPGQWLDVMLPGLRKAGGFTITSTPREARPTTERPAYLELAIQNSANPPAKWLHRPENEILGANVLVRAGGSFTWPPPRMNPSAIDRLVLVAGGVGINPLVSIFSHLMQQTERPKQIHLMYATKAIAPIDADRILFVSRVKKLVEAATSNGISLDLFLTGVSEDEISHAKGLPQSVIPRRIGGPDLDKALGPESDRGATVCYVCGPPKFTDTFVDYLRSRKGMDEGRVLCEKWW